VCGYGTWGPRPLLQDSCKANTKWKTRVPMPRRNSLCGATTRSFLSLTFLLAAPAARAEETWPPTSPLPGWGSYYDTRKIVTIVRYWSPADHLDSTAILDDAGRPASADSVRRLLEPNPKRTTADATEYVPTALDPQARSSSQRQGLPAFTAKTFATGALHDWLAALDPERPLRAWDGFMAIAAGSLRSWGTKGVVTSPQVI